MPSPIPAELPCASGAGEAARCASPRHSPVHRSEWRVVSAALSGSTAESMGPRETAPADCALGRRGMAADQDWAGLGGRALPATWPFCPGMRGARPRPSSPRCRICLACKFGSCHASFIFVPRGLYTLIPLAAPVRRGFYVSEFVNSRQAVAVKSSVPPSRLVVSRTRITPLPLAVSTHAPPLLSL